MDKVCEFADLRDEVEDIVVDWIVSELFCYGPDWFGGEGVVEGDQVFCLRNGWAHWLF